jgi:hypothetical protein
MLPDALEFLKFGWWVIHVVAIGLLYVYAYRRGVREGRRSAGAAKPSDRAPADGTPPPKERDTPRI